MDKSPSRNRDFRPSKNGETALLREALPDEARVFCEINGPFAVERAAFETHILDDNEFLLFSAAVETLRGLPSRRLLTGWTRPEGAAHDPRREWLRENFAPSGQMRAQRRKPPRLPGSNGRRD